MPKKGKLAVATLGCRTNQYETQGYIDQLQKMGYTLEDSQGGADLCIVNTCTVTHSADRSSLAEIRRLLARHPSAKVVVTGCMTESSPDAILALDPRVSIVPNLEKETLVSTLFPEEEDLPEWKIEEFLGHKRAFVKVQDGCNSFCTYCIIPYVRGRSRSYSLDSVVCEVEGLVANGYKEVVLTGINIGDFDGGGRLADLVRAVDSVEGLQRLRISSIDADEVDADLTAAVLEGKTTCPSMHIVLQSGSNTVLKRMNRKYTKQMFLDTIHHLRAKSPDFTFTTDVIVGFPGESDTDFRETLEVIEEVEFAKVHMFPFSPRKRTRAALYPNRVEGKILQQRKEECLSVIEKTGFSLREKFQGREFPILLEEEKEGIVSGLTPNFLRVFLPKGPYAPGEIVPVRLVENQREGFLGEAL